MIYEDEDLSHLAYKYMNLFTFICLLASFNVPYASCLVPEVAAVRAVHATRPVHCQSNATFFFSYLLLSMLKKGVS